MMLVDFIKSASNSACYLNGEWVGEKTRTRIDVLNPATGEKIGSVPNLGKVEAEQVINDAYVAWQDYKNLTAKERADLLFRFRKQIVDNVDALAELLTLEQGKPLREAKAEIVSGANTIEWYAEEVKRIYGETIASFDRNKRLMTIKQSVGVVGAITPWNFPSAMIARKCAPALASGCTIVIKPAPDTPLSALALAHLAECAGFPKGVFNVITGDAKPIGEALCDSKFVRLLSFTGSTATGKILLAQSAKTVKKTIMELGGNAPFIVFDDANLDSAVAGVIESKFRNAGQTCVSSDRFYAHASIVDTFVEKLQTVVSKLRLGNGLDKDTHIGPMIHTDAVSRVQTLVTDAVEQGAILTYGGKAENDRYFQPTILTDCNDDMRVFAEETFSPIIAIQTFTDETDVIAHANASEYGLAGYFYSNDISRIYRVSERLEVGQVGVNTGNASADNAPFGGYKASGIGREKAGYGIEEYLEVKTVCVGVES